MVWIPRCILAVLVCVVGIIWLSDSRGVRASSAEIQLNTGDLRYLWEGKVVHVKKMPEPYRSTLFRAARQSQLLTGDWEQCATFPNPGSNHPDRMCQRFFQNAATWLEYEPAVGLQVAEDLALYVKKMHAQQSLPESFLLLSWVARDADGTTFIREGWQHAEDIVPYLREHGLEQQVRDR